jgi:hypothetical protein
MKTDAQKSDCWAIVLPLHFVDQWLVNTPAGAFCLRADDETTCFPLGLRQCSAQQSATQRKLFLLSRCGNGDCISSSGDGSGAPCRGFASPINGDRR